MMKRTEKGMALAGTLIMMTIVLMLSVLMMSLLLYSSQMVALQTQNIDDRIVLDGIGQRFLENKDDYKAFLQYYVDKNESVNYYAEDGNISSDPTLVIKGTISGRDLTLAVKNAGSTRTLTVSSLKKNRQLMKITCKMQEDIKTGEKTAVFKSWNYGVNKD